MTVSVVIVAYNEEETLKSLLEDLKEQTFPKEQTEIVFVDSCSTDATREIMQAFADNQNCYKNVQILTNPDKKLSAGCNIALRAYTGDVFVRIDAHASIPDDFIEKNIKNIESGEMVSGGKRPNVIDGENPWKKTLLLAESSMFGSSVASYRRSDEKRYVDSLFHGMYRREVFDTVGFYNERIGRTEDNEMSYRIRKAGYKLCYDPEIISYQHTRNSLKRMLTQKFQNGYWIGLTLGVCPACLSLFHFVPFVFLLAIIGTAIFGICGICWPAALLWAVYGAANLATTLLAIFQNGFKLIYCSLPVLFLLLHVSYGLGTLCGVFSLPFKLSGLRENTDV